MANYMLQLRREDGEPLHAKAASSSDLNGAVMEAKEFLEKRGGDYCDVYRKRGNAGNTLEPSMIQATVYRERAIRHF